MSEWVQACLVLLLFSAAAVVASAAQRACASLADAARALRELRDEVGVARKLLEDEDGESLVGALAEDMRIAVAELSGVAGAAHRAEKSVEQIARHESARSHGS